MKYNFSKLIYIEKDRVGKDFKYFMNSKKANRVLKWKNIITMDKGLDKTINWHLKNINNLKNKKMIYRHKV